MFWPFYVDILFFLMLTFRTLKLIKQELNWYTTQRSECKRTIFSFTGDNNTNVTLEVLFVSPGVSDVFLLQYTVSDLYQRHTKNSNFIRDQIVYKWLPANSVHHN
jgi:hypothetical protein